MEDLRSGIEHIKQAKAHMLQATWIMSDCISKLRELEEENAGLRAKLESFIQSDDSYMKLPLDADGVPIRLGDTVWYIGIDVDIAKDYPLKVDGFVRVPGVLETFIETQEFQSKAIATESLTHKQPEPADSWEKLEEDAAKEVCAYAGASFSIVDQDRYSCTGCRFDDCSNRKASCWLQMNSELMARAKRLAGAE